MSRSWMIGSGTSWVGCLEMVMCILMLKRMMRMKGMKPRMHILKLSPHRRYQCPPTPSLQLFKLMHSCHSVKLPEYLWGKAAHLHMQLYTFAECINGIQSPVIAGEMRTFATQQQGAHGQQRPQMAPSAFGTPPISDIFVHNGAGCLRSRGRPVLYVAHTHWQCLGKPANFINHAA